MKSKSSHGHKKTHGKSLHVCNPFFGIKMGCTGTPLHKVGRVINSLRARRRSYFVGGHRLEGEKVKSRGSQDAVHCAYLRCLGKHEVLKKNFEPLMVSLGNSSYMYIYMSILNLTGFFGHFG